jgi:hypothetical protein
MDIPLRLLEKHAGLWIALDDSLKEILSSDSTVKGALKKAMDAGYQDPVLYKVPRP